jgi:hypothetical protein
LKEEALDHTVWGAPFGRCFGPVVRQTINEWTFEYQKYAYNFVHKIPNVFVAGQYHQCRSTCDNLIHQQFVYTFILSFVGEINPFVCISVVFISPMEDWVNSSSYFFESDVRMTVHHKYYVRKNQLTRSLPPCSAHN